MSVPLSVTLGAGKEHFSSRSDAIFGSLGLPTGPQQGILPGGGVDEILKSGAAALPSTSWRLRQDVAPFQAGKGLEDYTYSSDEDEDAATKPIMTTAEIDASDEEQEERWQQRRRQQQQQAQKQQKAVKGRGKRRRCGGADSDDADGDDSDDSGGGAKGNGNEDVDEEEDEEQRRKEDAVLRATVQFRRAFEREEEEDDYDRLATQTMAMPWGPRASGPDDTKPAGSTEVVDDNPYDRASDVRHSTARRDDGPQGLQGVPSAAVARRDVGANGHRGLELAMDIDSDDGDGSTAVAGALEAAGATAEAMDTCDVPVANGAGPAGPAVAEAAPIEQQQQQQRGGKRVQWVDLRPAPTQAAQAADEHRANRIDNGSGQRHGEHQEPRHRGREVDFQQPLQHRQRGQQLPWSRRGGNGRTVPDHIVNPHKYTCYTLDEPLFVGRGDRQPQQHAQRSAGGRGGDSNGHDGAVPPGAAAAEAAEMRQAAASARHAAARAASNVDQADHDPQDRATTSFGSGIAFRPRSQRAAPAAAAASADTAGPVAARPGENQPRAATGGAAGHHTAPAGSAEMGGLAGGSRGAKAALASFDDAADEDPTGAVGGSIVDAPEGPSPAGAAFGRRQAGKRRYRAGTGAGSEEGGNE